MQEVGLHAADDADILARATAEGRVIITSDQDFAAMVAVSGAQAPSVVTLRLGNVAREETCRAALSVAAMFEGELARGTLVTVTRHEVRLHGLPVRQAQQESPKPQQEPDQT